MSELLTLTRKDHMEKASKIDQTNTQTKNEAIDKLRKYVAILERDLRRTSNLLHSDSIWTLADISHHVEVNSMLSGISDRATELVDWVNIHAGTLIKQNKPTSSKSE